MRTFGLDAALFAVLLVAAALSVGRELPIVGATLGFLSAVALGRTAWLVQQYEIYGVSMRRAKKLAFFADSLTLAALSLVGMGFGVVVGAFVGGSAVVVVLGFCWPAGAASQGANWLASGALVGGLIGGCYAFVRLQLDLWRYQDGTLKMTTTSKLNRTQPATDYPLVDGIEALTVEHGARQIDGRIRRSGGD